jgi:hypothetical protein
MRHERPDECGKILVVTTCRLLLRRVLLLEKVRINGVTILGRYGSSQISAHGGAVSEIPCLPPRIADLVDEHPLGSSGDSEHEVGGVSVALDIHLYPGVHDEQLQPWFLLVKNEK